MNLKQTAATIVTTGGALAAWLVGGTTTNHTVAPATIVQRSPVDTKSEELATEIGRLRDRLRPTTTPRQPGRNLFRFHAAPVAHVPAAALTPSELFALGHALLDAAADGFGHFVPADEVFGLDLSPPSVPRALDEVAIAAWVDSGKARAVTATRSGVGVQLVVDTRALATVAEAVCDEAARVLAA